MFVCRPRIHSARARLRRRKLCVGSEGTPLPDALMGPALPIFQLIINTKKKKKQDGSTRENYSFLQYLERTKAPMCLPLSFCNNCRYRMDFHTSCGAVCLCRFCGLSALCVSAKSATWEHFFADNVEDVGAVVLALIMRQDSKGRH